MCDECRYPGELAQQEPDEDRDLDYEAAEHDRLHDKQVHGGGPCDCPPEADPF